jgi:hypothetical protein
MYLFFKNNPDAQIRLRPDLGPGSEKKIIISNPQHCGQILDKDPMQISTGIYRSLTQKIQIHADLDLKQREKVWGKKK